MFNYSYEDMRRTMNAISISAAAFVIFLSLTIYTLVIGNVYCAGFGILAGAAIIVLRSKRDEYTRIEKQLLKESNK